MVSPYVLEQLMHVLTFNIVGFIISIVALSLFILAFKQHQSEYNFIQVFLLFSLINIIIYSINFGIYIYELSVVVGNDSAGFTIPSESVYLLFQFYLFPIATIFTYGIGFFLLGLKNTEHRGNLLISFSIISIIFAIISISSSIDTYQMIYQGEPPNLQRMELYSLTFLILNHARYLVLTYFGVREKMYSVMAGGILFTVGVWIPVIMMQTMPTF